MLLSGEKVLVVEPEPFTGYALERRLYDFDADEVMLTRSIHPEESILKRDLDVAVVDVEAPHARAVIDYLSGRGVKVVKVGHSAPASDREKMASGRTGWTPSEVDVAKPYAMSDIERAIARQYRTRA